MRLRVVLACAGGSEGKKQTASEEASALAGPEGGTKLRGPGVAAPEPLMIVSGAEADAQFAV